MMIYAHLTAYINNCMSQFLSRLAAPKIACRRELFPAPVAPTTPIKAPLGTWQISKKSQVKSGEKWWKVVKLKVKSGETEGEKWWNWRWKVVKLKVIWRWYEDDMSTKFCKLDGETMVTHVTRGETWWNPWWKPGQTMSNALPNSETISCRCCAPPWRTSPAMRKSLAYKTSTSENPWDICWEDGFRCLQFNKPPFGSFGHATL